ncbi:MAG: hypothetical protein AB8F78_07430 [Saprospiraceae bacterium]
MRPLFVVDTLGVPKGQLLRYYFTLQLTRLKRLLRELGVHPLLGAVLGIALFGILSAYLFYKTEYASWLYGLFAVYTISGLGEQQRVAPLKALFTKANYINVRLLENAAVALPFLIYLTYEAAYAVALAVFVVAIALAFFSRLGTVSKVVPTPFGKTPFENIIGFRKSFLFVGLIYFVIFKAIQVDNYNLGIASLGAIFFLMMSFQAKPEPSHFVWIFSDNASTFLKRKIKYSAICATLLALPGLIALGIFFPDHLIASCSVFLVGQLFLLSMVLAKYSAYPNEISLPQAILYGLSLWFPPMLLIVGVLFYRKAKRNLKPILR